MSRVLVTRMDSAGDVILAGPAVRAASTRGEVTFLCGPAGEPAARLLPDVTEVLVWNAPWTGFSPPCVDARSTAELVDVLAARRFEAAAVLTSFHQSPLPMALLLRLAGVGSIAAVSVDYPGSLLDHRVGYREESHEVEQALEVTTALGFDRPHDDRLSLTLPSRPAVALEPGFVVVHPEASVPARSLPGRLVHDTIRRLSERGTRVVVTGTAEEKRQRAVPALPGVTDLRGTTSFTDLTAVIAHADAVVVGNTAPAHIAAATGTPVVSVFAPVVPAHRWRPWRVPAVVLGDQDISCGGCRSRKCPLPAQECVEHLQAVDVVEALDRLRTVAAATPGSA